MRVKKITELNRITLDEFKALDKIPLVVVLDNVRSLNNIGSVFRCSDAFKVECVFLCGITAVPPHVDIHKTALGAEDSVDWLYFETTEESLRLLKDKNYVLCAVEQTTDSVMLDEFECDLSSSYAVVVGNEVKGVQQAVVDCCDYAIEIPQMGTKHSLNVSIATGIVVWEFFKQMTVKC